MISSIISLKYVMLPIFLTICATLNASGNTTSRWSLSSSVAPSSKQQHLRRHRRNLASPPLGYVVCQTPNECEAKFISMNTGGSFYYGPSYPSQGCFAKNNNVYFGTGGSINDMSTVDLAGVRTRVWCDASVAAPSGSPADSPTTGSLTTAAPSVGQEEVVITDSPTMKSTEGPTDQATFAEDDIPEGPDISDGFPTTPPATLSGPDGEETVEPQADTTEGGLPPTDNEDFQFLLDSSSPAASPSSASTAAKTNAPTSKSPTVITQEDGEEEEKEEEVATSEDLGVEFVESNLDVVSDDPVASKELWMIVLVFAVGLLLVALYVVKSRRGRKMEQNEVNAVDIDEESDVPSQMPTYIEVERKQSREKEEQEGIPTLLMRSLGFNQDDDPSSRSGSKSVGCDHTTISAITQETFQKDNNSQARAKDVRELSVFQSQLDSVAENSSTANGSTVDASTSSFVDIDAIPLFPNMCGVYEATESNAESNGESNTRGSRSGSGTKSTKDVPQVFCGAYGDETCSENKSTWDYSTQYTDADDDFPSINEGINNTGLLSLDETEQVNNTTKSKKKEMLM